jgi:hypothetical protein
MEFFVGLIIGISIGFFWGIWRATQSFIERIIERPEEIHEIMDRVKKVSEEEKKNNPEFTLEYITKEEHNGIVYLYDENNVFLAQGSDEMEAWGKIERRFPNRNFTYKK